MRLIRTLATASALLMAFSVSASDLTVDAIDRWMAAMDSVQQWAEEHDVPDHQITEGSDGMPNFVSALDELDSDNRAGLESVTRDHGFDGAVEWAETSNRITRAFMALEMQQQDVDFDDARRQMEAQMQQIEQNPDISDAQKQQMRQQMQAMQQNMQMVEGMTEDVPEADRQAVSERRSQLKAFFEQQEPQR